MTTPRQRPNVTQAIHNAVSRFRYWLAFARPGDTYIYHTGLLSVDRLELSTDAAGVVHYLPVEPFDSLAREVSEAASRGQVYLVQRRKGPAEYLYITQRSSKR